MTSPFDLDRQNDQVDSRIVVAMERISEAFRVLLWDQSKALGLSPIQIQTLIFLHHHSTDKCTIGYLAKEFNMTKATISDSVRVLIKKNLVKKVPNPADTRSFHILLTREGSTIAERTSQFSSSIEKPLHELTPTHKEQLLSGLLHLIHRLNQSGIITIQRMCFTCRHYRTKDANHYCSLLETKLADSEIRLDCPEHDFAGAS